MPIKPRRMPQHHLLILALLFILPLGFHSLGAKLSTREPASSTAQKNLHYHHKIDLQHGGNTHRIPAQKPTAPASLSLESTVLSYDDTTQIAEFSIVLNIAPRMTSDEVRIEWILPAAYQGMEGNTTQFLGSVATGELRSERVRILGNPYEQAPAFALIKIRQGEQWRQDSIALSLRNVLNTYLEKQKENASSDQWKPLQQANPIPAQQDPKIHF